MKKLLFVAIASLLFGQADRHLTPAQTSQIKQALTGSSARIAVFTVADRERLKFAGEIAAAFAQSSWKVIMGPVPSAAANVNLSQMEVPASVALVLYMNGDNPPKQIVSQAQVDQIAKAFDKAGIALTVVRSNGHSPSLAGNLYSLFVGAIDTTVPIVFVGAKPQ